YFDGSPENPWEEWDGAPPLATATTSNGISTYQNATLVPEEIDAPLHDYLAAAWALADDQGHTPATLAECDGDLSLWREAIEAEISVCFDYLCPDKRLELSAALYEE